MGCEYDYECWVGENLWDTDVACFKIQDQYLPSGLRKKKKGPDNLPGKAVKIRSGYGTFRTEVFYTKLLGKLCYWVYLAWFRTASQ
jgi:hypothetical protein